MWKLKWLNIKEIVIQMGLEKFLYTAVGRVSSYVLARIALDRWLII